MWHDTYHAPLPPLVDAVAVRLVKAGWKMTAREVVYWGDRAIAAMSIAIFLASLVLLYLTAARLFDARLAALILAMWGGAVAGMAVTASTKNKGSRRTNCTCCSSR
ncbi:MAG TPA: hypothetical protein VK993_04945 [Chthoniobacterales bacterium]|nr:hypothetical protein [Chthoniobacterales bacterium]